MSIVKAFYAYPSHKDDLLEDIRDAVKIINNSNNVNITTWENLSIGGKYIIDGILKAITECDLFICDLTYINYNVLYELGYALSQEKKIWITINKTHPKATENYRSFKQLTSIGYSEYKNSSELADNFFAELPHEYVKSVDIKGHQLNLARNLVYLKCEADTSASNSVRSIISKAQIPTKIEDQYEGFEPLNWYLNVLPNAVGVVIHFHTDKSDIESSVSVGRKALVAGLSKGLGLNTLLLAHEPFKTPLDYHDSLKIHSTASQAEGIIKDWISDIVKLFHSFEEDHKEYKAEQRALGKISNLIIGDYVAENENQDLLEYFLETAEYNEALSAQQILFVGRKGTGKTANLIKLKNQLSSDKRNFIVTIQPQGHEFEGVLMVLDKLINNSEQGHLIESIWKYLVYTEIARQYYVSLDNQPLHFQKTEDEDKFIQFVVENQRLINADFTLRLGNIISNLQSLDHSDTVEQQRLKVSEFLHNTMINHLRNHLGNVLHKKANVKILIDNLDKSWNDNADLEKLSILLFGLLNVVQNITEEFQRNSYKHINVNLSLVVFLRSDIFSRIMSHAPERDKIPTKHLSWSEPRLLFRVIEKRINYSISGITSPDALWKDYFCSHVDGIPLTSFIENLIIPRPRDIIFLFKAAFQEAINRGHTKVEEEDFKSAENSYSEYALQSLFPENGNRIKDLESILYEFAGQDSIISQEELEKSLRKNSSEDVHHLINILCEMTFVGQEIQQDKFEYYSEKRPAQIINKLAERLAERHSRSKRYEIHPAFHAYLGVEKSKLSKTQQSFIK